MNVEVSLATEVVNSIMQHMMQQDTVTATEYCTCPQEAEGEAGGKDAGTQPPSPHRQRSPRPARLTPTCQQFITVVRLQNWAVFAELYRNVEDQSMAEYAIRLLAEHPTAVPRGIIVQLYHAEPGPVRTHIERLLKLQTLEPARISEVLLPFCHDFAAFLKVGMHYPALFNHPEILVAQASELFSEGQEGSSYESLLLHVARTRPELMPKYLDAIRARVPRARWWSMYYPELLGYLTEEVYAARMAGKLNLSEFNARAGILRHVVAVCRQAGAKYVVEFFRKQARDSSAGLHYLTLMEVDSALSLLRAVPEFKEELGQWFSPTTRPLFTIHELFRKVYQSRVRHANVEHLVKYVN